MEVKDSSDFFVGGGGENVFDFDFAAGVLLFFDLALVVELGLAVEVCSVGLIIIRVEGYNVAIELELKVVDDIVEVVVDGSVLLAVVGGGDVDGV